MEEKIFALLEKMYNDLSTQIKDLKTDMDNRFNEVDNKFIDIDNRFNEIDNRLIVIENKLDTNSKTFLDGYNQLYEKQTITDAKVDNILSELEIHDLRIRQIKHMLKISSKKMVLKKSN